MVGDAVSYSGENGDFRIDHLKEGNIRLEVKSEGHNDYSREFFLADDSRISVMLRSERGKKQRSELLRNTGFYGGGGLFYVVDSRVTAEEQYKAGYDYLRTEYRPSGRKIERNTSSLKIGMGISDSTEIILSLMVTEDSLSNTVGEDDIFGFRKELFMTDNIRGAFSYFITDKNNNAVLSTEFGADENIIYLANVCYDDKKGKAKLDIGALYSIREDISLFTELVQDYSNDHVATSYGVCGKVHDYNLRFTVLDNSKYDYRVYSAGFSLDF